MVTTKKKTQKEKVPEKKTAKKTEEKKPEAEKKSDRSKPGPAEKQEKPILEPGKKPEKKPETPKPPKPDRYFEAVGRRKTAIARVRLYTKPGDFLVNGKLYSVYFPTASLRKIAEDSLQKMKLFGRFRVSVKVSGGGLHAQAEAIRHGLARCLVKFNPDFRKRLKRAGFIRRDPRIKERKKPGLKRARRAPQWQKR